MSKIVMITGSFPPDKCGVGDYTKLLCEQLSNEGYEIHVISSFKVNCMGYFIHNDIDNWSIKNTFKVLNLIDSINPDIVHIQYPTKAYGKKLLINFLPFLLRLKRYFVISTIHEYSSNSFLGKIRTSLNIIGSHRVIVVDPIYRLDLKRHNFNINKVDYINIASNIPKCNLTNKEKEVFRKNIAFDSDKKLIGYFGFVNKGKGLESLLESIYVLKKKNKLNSSLVIIAELTLDNNYHRSILDLINKYELNNDVMITGYLEESKVAEYISICDFFVFPFIDGYSPKNGSCLAALQEGKKIITTKPRTDISYSENIIFIDKYDNVEKLAEQISILQSSSQQIAIYNNSTYTWKHIASRHNDLYKDFLKRKNFKNKFL